MIIEIVINNKINHNLKTTNDLINYLTTIAPQKVIIQTHPERWFAEVLIV